MIVHCSAGCFVDVRFLASIADLELCSGPLQELAAAKASCTRCGRSCCCQEASSGLQCRRSMVDLGVLSAVPMAAVATVLYFIHRNFPISSLLDARASGHLVHPQLRR